MEQRQYKRSMVKGNADVSLRSLDPQVWSRNWSGTEYLLRDISLAGIGIVAGDPIATGSRLSIDLRLGKAGASIRVFGKVMWIEKADTGYRAGISFSWWRDDQDKKSVNRFVERLNPEN